MEIVWKFAVFENQVQRSAMTSRPCGIGTILITIPPGLPSCQPYKTHASHTP